MRSTRIRSWSPTSCRCRSPRLTCDERMLDLLREILDKMDSLEEPKLGDALDLKPNVMGVGVNLNVVIEVIQRLIGKSGRR